MSERKRADLAKFNVLEMAGFRCCGKPLCDNLP